MGRAFVCVCAPVCVCVHVCVWGSEDGGLEVIPDFGTKGLLEKLDNLEVPPDQTLKKTDRLPLT